MSTSSMQADKLQQSMPKLELVPLTLKKYPKLVITKEFQSIFEFFCSENRAVEWSGVMYYRVENDLTNISEMIITPVDILLMDIGSSAHTEFQYSTDVVSYQMNRGLFNCGTGLVHSH